MYQHQNHSWKEQVSLSNIMLKEEMQRAIPDNKNPDLVKTHYAASIFVKDIIKHCLNSIRHSSLGQLKFISTAQE